MIKINYGTRRSGVRYYSSRGFTIGSIPPDNMPAGALGIIQNESVDDSRLVMIVGDAPVTNKNFDLGDALKAILQLAHTHESFYSMVRKKDSTNIRELIETNVPKIYDPNILLMVYLLEGGSNGNIAASVVTTGLTNSSNDFSGYRGLFINGKHFIGYISKRDGTTEIIENNSLLSKLTRGKKSKGIIRDISARFREPLHDFEIGIQVLDYSSSELQSSEHFVEIKPAKSIGLE